jgi:hypothetical protein
MKHKSTIGAWFIVLGVVFAASGLWVRAWVTDAYRFDWIGEQDRRTYLQQERELDARSWEIEALVQRTRADFDREEREKKAFWEHLLNEATKETDPTKKKAISDMMDKEDELPTPSESWREHATKRLDITQGALDGRRPIGMVDARRLPTVHALGGAGAVLGAALVSVGVLLSIGERRRRPIA